VDVAITKKPVWHYSEIPQDEAVTALMPGFEIQYIVDDEHCEHDTQAVFGHCVFPPISQHSPHRHTEADELVYVIKGRVVNGQIDENGVATEYECGPGVATFVAKGRIHWSRNPFDEPAEFVFAYYGASSLEKSGLIDLTNEVPIKNEPVDGQRVLPLELDPALVQHA
jgi:quercetin dioxygenase-like cupin family protein